eukprot:12102550-Alexandrium_andersonii.AAC.1
MRGTPLRSSVEALGAPGLPAPDPPGPQCWWSSDERGPCDRSWQSAAAQGTGRYPSRPLPGLPEPRTCGEPPSGPSGW